MNNTQNIVPVLPETAPFSPEQRAWLNGFLAGIFSRAPMIGGVQTPEAEARSLQSLTILFGSQTGNAEGLAKRAAKVAGQRGFAPTVCEMSAFDGARLAQEKNLLLIASTYGDGEPPDNAKGLLEFLQSEAAPQMPQLRYSVCALGDTNYEKFCQCGKDFDAALESKQAHRAAARVDCDVDFDESFAKWLESALTALSDGGGSAQAPGAGVTEVAPASAPAGVSAEPKWSRTNPFPARLVTNRVLNAEGSAKEVRHFEFDLADSGMSYEAGDALGLVPMNCPDLVGDIIAALGCDPGAPVPVPGGGELPLNEALLKHYEITRIPKPLLQFVAERSGDGSLKELIAPSANGALEKFLWGREVVDLLLAHPSVKIAACEFVGLLRKLPHRFYSISSSPKVHSGQVHLTVGIVRYRSLERGRKGVCSTFLADRVTEEDRAPIFFHPNRNFRPPTDGARPVIMVGPGTGIAPFRAFLHERKAAGAAGKNWLFFGDQKSACDFLYREELEQLKTDGALTRLDTAFSRDQEQKVYVQHRMIENANELFDWLEQGAHFYVCGDASRMAKDVDKALHEVVVKAGGRTAEQAAEYVRRLSADKRYQRDVY